MTYFDLEKYVSNYLLLFLLGLTGACVLCAHVAADATRLPHNTEYLMCIRQIGSGS